VTARAVGIDVGGTFTDLVAIDADGRPEMRKVLSTPGDEVLGVLDALDALGTAEGIERVVHGTTIATNTLLERTGARVVLCATEGATDILALRRQERAALYDLTRHHQALLVPPDDTVSVPERVAPDGVVKRLADTAARDVAERVRSRAPESVAVALLHSYLDPRHEQRLARELGEHVRDVPVVLSSDTLPEVREYERTATTVAEAYLRPRVGGYLEQLASRLRARGAGSILVMSSSGGLRDVSAARTTAAALALSGPSGGVAGAAEVARLSGVTRALTIDIGGTSADAGVIIDGEPLVEAGGEVAGVPIALPRVLVETVSAGGGSIGWVDDGGALRVGPRSAGSRPGPAAFGRGGTQATVTDAHVVLGTLSAQRLSGGVRLDPAGAVAAVAALAVKLGATVERTARAMIAAADAAVARALRRVSVERGLDPRSCALIAFGGGGPLHACALAEQLSMTTIIVPPMAGVLSALGLAVAPERHEAMASVMRRTSDLGRAALAALGERSAEHLPPHLQRRTWVRARFEGQGHELDVPLAAADDGASVASRFAALHHARYGFTLDHDVELISVRAAALGRAPDVALARRPTGESMSAIAIAPDETGFVIDDGGPRDRAIRGQAVVMLPDATMLVHPGWTAFPLPTGGWRMEAGA